MFRIGSLSFLALALAGVGANPISRRATCKPDFQAWAQTIYTGGSGTFYVNEWTPSLYAGGPLTLTRTEGHQAFDGGEFYVPFTEQTTNTYTFRPVADTNGQFALSGANGNLDFEDIAYNFPSPQEFSIDCYSCPDASQGSTFAIDCVISHPATGKCITGIAGGDTLTLETCNESSDQLYNFRGPK